MIYRITMSFFGNNFNPNNIISELNGNFLVIDKIIKGDKKKYIKGNYEFGNIDIWHINKFATEEQIKEYESFFVEFITNNYKTLKQNHVQDIHLFYDIYYDGDQCNFEILSKKQLRKLFKINLSLPISVHKLNQKELKRRSKEINETWCNAENE
jgi:hypothetical protein